MSDAKRGKSVSDTKPMKFCNRCQARENKRQVAFFFGSAPDWLKKQHVSFDWSENVSR